VRFKGHGAWFRFDGSGPRVQKKARLRSRGRDVLGLVLGVLLGVWVLVCGVWGVGSGVWGLRVRIES
jgi:hypothetical protein